MDTKEGEKERRWGRLDKRKVDSLFSLGTSEAQATTKAAKLYEKKPGHSAANGAAALLCSHEEVEAREAEDLAGRVITGHFVSYPAQTSDQTFIHAANPVMPSLGCISASRMRPLEHCRRCFT